MQGRFPEKRAFRSAMREPVAGTNDLAAGDSSPCFGRCPEILCTKPVTKNHTSQNYNDCNRAERCGVAASIGFLSRSDHRMPPIKVDDQTIAASHHFDIVGIGIDLTALCVLRPR